MFQDVDNKPYVTPDLISSKNSSRSGKLHFKNFYKIEPVGLNFNPQYHFVLS